MAPEDLGTTTPRASQGSALVVAMLVTAVMALLGISFLLLAETERRIAENEKRAAQSLYAAEAGLRAVKRWFDEPGAALTPRPSEVDRTLRRIVDETDPLDPTAAVPADGIVGSYPYYKQGWDADGDGRDDLFDRPYRGSLVLALQGTADGPDLRIDESDTAARAFLATLSATLLGDFPGEPGGVRAGITRIDVYAPPYERFGATWQRSGIATVAITARIYQDREAGREVLAERRLQAVLGEAPFRGPLGPLHSCGDISFVPRSGGDMTVRWGPMMARGNVSVGPPAAPPIPPSLPRSTPSSPGEDRLSPTVPTDFDSFLPSVGSNTIADPWFRILAGGRIIGGGSASQVQAPTAAPGYENYSNLIQNLGVAVCPHYEYRVWKSIAQSGGPDVRYFVWTAAGYKENGWGGGRSFQEITNGQSGVFFFDTADGVEPRDSNSDGTFENLAPEDVELTGAWSFRGFVFLNTRSIRLNGVTGVSTNLRPPGEPFLDEDDDRTYDPGERFVNLNYGTASTGDGAVQALFGENGAVRDARGPDLAGGSVSLRGILYNTGRFEATGSGTVYGSIVAAEGVTQDPADGSVDTPTLVWDDSIASDWPPTDLPGVPRVVITDWDVAN